MKKANKQRKKSLQEEIRIIDIMTLVATSLSLLLLVAKVVLEAST